MDTTVIIPAYKADKTILQTVSSVLESKNIKVQVIVIEDGIFDKTSRILENFKDKIIFHSFVENQGAQKVRNFGLSLVKTNTVMFLDADDYLKPDFLAALHKKLMNSKAGLAFGTMKIVYENKNKVKVFSPPQNQSREQIADRWLRGQPGPHPCGVLWRTDTVNKIGGWNEAITRNQDGEIILRALSMGHDVVVTNESSAIYRCHTGDRVSANLADHTFLSQEKILNLMIDWDRRKSDFDFSPALAEFCIYEAIKAYRTDKIDTGLFWEAKSREFASINKLMLKGGFKKALKFLIMSVVSIQWFAKKISK